MTQPGIDDLRLRLIQSAIKFANGLSPAVAFDEVIQQTREKLKLHGIERFASNAATRELHGSQAAARLAQRLLIRRALLWIVLLNRSPTRVGGKKRGKIFHIVVRNLVEELGNEGPRALVLSGLEGCTWGFEQFNVPLWIDYDSCVKDAVALMLNDYRGIRDRIFMCPYGSPVSMKASDLEVAEYLDRLVADRDVHYFADLRYAKGARMKYCSPQHQRADYMRRYRKKAKQ